MMTSETADRIPEKWSGKRAVPESELYSTRYRAVALDEEIKVYNGAGCLPVKNAVSFDIMSNSFSSVDMIVAAVLSEVLLCIRGEFLRRQEDISDLEGRAKLDIANPLAAVGVRGIDGISLIEGIELDIYLFTFLDEEEARESIDKALQRAICYQSLKKAFPISLRLSFAE
ncbi:MAG: hypothetical protein IKE52_02900 [Mogibacterium sp.]|nr:hypothetical protein [Mogibacterium sp.]